MNQEVTLGICISNADPLNHGRIRYVPYEEYKSTHNSQKIGCKRLYSQ